MDVIFVYCLISYCIKPFGLAFFKRLGEGLADKALNTNKKTTPTPASKKSGSTK